MADDITLRRRLSPPTVPYNIALKGQSSANRSTGVSGEVYWRDPNDATSQWQLLGEAKAGQTLSVPFDPKSRTVEFSLVSKNQQGYRSTSLLDEGVRTTFTVGAPALTSLSFSSPNVTGGIANNSGVGDIAILRKLSTDTDFSIIQTVSAATTSFTDAPAINGSYQYKLTQAGQDGESNTLSVTVTGAGSGSGTPPDSLSAIWDGVDTVMISWTNHGGTGNNVVERKIQNGDWTSIGSVSPSSTSTTDFQEPTGVTRVIYYRVRNDDVTGYSNEDFVTV